MSPYKKHHAFGPSDRWKFNQPKSSRGIQLGYAPPWRWSVSQGTNGSGLWIFTRQQKRDEARLRRLHRSEPRGAVTGCSVTRGGSNPTARWGSSTVLSGLVLQPTVRQDHTFQVGTDVDPKRSKKLWIVTPLHIKVPQPPARWRFR